MLTIRPSTPEDVALILQFIRELATYERAPDSVTATEELILRYGFGPEKKFECVIAEWEGRAAGFALFFYHFSTWAGKPGVFLEDLFVRPEFRGKGIGKSLLKFLAARAIAEDCYAVRWEVLDWNTPAIEFYKSLGSWFADEWRGVRLEGENLKKLAQSKQ